MTRASALILLSCVLGGLALGIVAGLLDGAIELRPPVVVLAGGLLLLAALAYTLAVRCANPARGRRESGETGEVLPPGGASGGQPAADPLQAVLDEYGEAIARLPDGPDRAAGYYGRGVVRYELGHLGAAADDLGRAVDLYPDGPEKARACTNLGNVRIDLGRPEEALADFDRAIALFPDLPDRAIAYIGRGNARDTLGQREAALADYDQAVALDPQMGAAYSNRGLVRMALGQAEAALADFQQALERFSEDSSRAAVHYNQARAWVGLGRAEEACAALAAAIALDPVWRERAGATADFEPIRGAACFRAVVGAG